MKGAAKKKVDDWFDPNQGRTVSHWQQLQEIGVTVVPVLSQENRRTIIQHVLDAVRHSPELKEPIKPGDPLLVTLGGFGALGTASSYHFPIIRRVRGEILRKVSPIFAEQDKNVELLADRLCLRMNGQAPTSEMWHRDISPAENRSDDIIGGWLNLSNYNQFLSCVLRTHTEDRREPLTRVGDTAVYETGSGKKKTQHEGPVLEVHPDFLIVRAGAGTAKVPLDDILEVEHLDDSLEGALPLNDKGFARMKRKRIPQLKEQKVSVLVPPGCYVSFNTVLIHEVLATPAGGTDDEPYCKLFTGFRLSTDYESLLFRGNDRIYREQGLPLLGSGQKVYNYSANHYGQVERGMYKNTNYPLEHGLETWSTRFIDKIKRMDVTTKAGNVYTSVVRAFPSLTELGLKFEEYSEGELEVAAGGARRQWKSVWGLWDGRNWSSHPFAIDRVAGPRGRLLDLDGPGPSDMSAYAPARSSKSSSHSSDSRHSSNHSSKRARNSSNSPVVAPVVAVVVDLTNDEIDLTGDSDEE